MARPPKHSDPEQVQAIIDAYFEQCNRDKRPYTITGLALALDLSRQGLIEYGQKQAFSAIVKRAKQRVEQYLEELVLSKQNPIGPMFNLKSNFGWRDKDDSNINININVIDAIQAARARARLATPINVTPEPLSITASSEDSDSDSG